MLPSPKISFENLRNLDTIVELKRVQKWVTYFCTQSLVYKKIKGKNMDHVTQVGKETVKLYEEYKSIEEKLKQKKEQLFNIFIAENIDFKQIDNYTIYKVPENEQIRFVKREDILNVLTDKIEDERLIENILSQILKNSTTKSHIKIVKKD